MRGTDHLAKPPVPVSVAGKDEQMPPSRIGKPCPRRSLWLAGGGTADGEAAGGRNVQAEFGAEHGRQVATHALVAVLEALRGLGELRDPIHAVVIGDGDG